MSDYSASLTPKLTLAVLQPNTFCNIDCRYCYLPNRLDNKRMTPQTLEHTFRFLLQDPSALDESFTLLWHGGEPTAVPVAFYESAFQLLEKIKPAGAPVQNRFSTNATLIDQEWCDLIKRWNVRIRVSVDGPKWLHDTSRVDRRQQGTYDRVIRGINCLRENGIEFDIISVVSERTIDAAAELWRFCQSTWAKAWHFCIEEILGVHIDNTLISQTASARLQNFFTQLLEIRNREAPDFYIRELDELIQGIPRSRGRIRRPDNIPLSIISVSWDGQISTFSPELLDAKHITYGDFIFGNVKTHTLQDVLNEPKLQSIYADIQRGISKCEETCKYFRICGGGCPSAKLFEHGRFDVTETLSCQHRVKAVGNVVLRHFQNRLSAPSNVSPAAPPSDTGFGHGVAAGGR